MSDPKKRTPFTPTDSMELVSLRVSIAKIAQRCGVETDQLKVLKRPLDDLIVLAKTRERGWNTLAKEIIDRLNPSIN